MSFDRDGYPTDEAIDNITTFEGTVAEFVDYVAGLWHWSDFVTIEGARTTVDQPAKRITFVTGGWSGNESVVGAIKDFTMFHTLFWQLSERGGRYVYEVPDDFWGKTGFWGDIRKMPKAAVR